MWILVIGRVWLGVSSQVQIVINNQVHLWTDGLVWAVVNGQVR